MSIIAPHEDSTGNLSKVLRKAISFPVLLGVLLAAGAFASTSSEGGALGTKVLTADDMFWHIAIGREILATRHWPTVEHFSFTLAGQDSVAYEWLGDVLIAAAQRWGGWRGLVGLLGGLSAGFVLLLYYLAYLRSKNLKAAAVACALLLPIAGAFFTLRPQLLGYIFLVITLICLERYRQGARKTLWLLPLVFLLWVNTHGTFAMGLLVVGLYWAAGLVGFERGCVVAQRWKPKQRRELLLVLLACMAVLPVTPYGTRLAAYPLEMALLRPTVMGNVTEWYPLALRHGVWAYAFLGLVLVFVVVQAMFGALVYRVEEIVLLAFGVWQSCLHVRFLFFFAAIFAPLLATLLARWVPAYAPQKDKYALNALLIALLALGLAALYPSSRALETAADEQDPRAAVEFLRQHPGLDPTFNEAWGGYLVWSGRKVFMDGRDVYENGGVLSDYVRIVNLDPEMRFLLRKYGVRACLVRRDSPLGTYLAALPDWKRVYADDLSVIYEDQGSHRGGPH